MAERRTATKLVRFHPGELARIGRCLDELTRLAQAGHDAALAERVRAALDEHWALARQVVQDRPRSVGAAPRPVIATTSSGRRFAALARYLLHGRSGEETERVAWTAGRNLGWRSSPARRTACAACRRRPHAG